MSIKIKTMKTLKDGKPHRMILDFKLLSEARLPDEYLATAPCIYSASNILGNNYLIVQYSSEEKEVYRIGQIISEYEFQKIIYHSKLAGERLHKINERYKMTYPEHYAREIETIKI